MSEFVVECFKIDEVYPHNNADALEIVKFYGYTCIVKKGAFKKDDEAIFIPVDAKVPLSDPNFTFLDTGKGRERERIRAKKLRGIFSNGLVVPNTYKFPLGEIDPKLLNITKHEPEIKYKNTSYAKYKYSPFTVKDYNIHPFYDLKGLRRYSDAIEEGTEVVITEKLHGTNASYCYSTKYDKLLCKSHKVYREKPVPSLWERFLMLFGYKKKCYGFNDDVWIKIPEMFNLKELLKKYPDFVFYGEIVGDIQKGYNYNVKAEQGIDIYFFDVYNVKDGVYVDYDVLTNMIDELNKETENKLKMVPVLYQGPWKGMEAHKDLAEGQSILGNHIREGYVVQPVKDSYNPNIGRLKLKYAGEGYLIKEGKV